MTKEQAESYRVDKAGWDAGPWMDEPDRVDFHHAGFPCLLLRHERWGHWCGYVGLPPGHPLYGKGYNDIDVAAHGGLSYAEGCAGPICHVPQPGEPDAVWWVGFDCGHWLDVSPGMIAYERRILPADMLAEGERLAKAMPPRMAPVYRDVGYVRAAVEHLATQLAALT
jgi:hypothetical protein